MQIRDAVPADAAAACAVLRRSIVELCSADHGNDAVIMARWLANKTPEIVASWIAKDGNSVLAAVEGAERSWRSGRSPIKARSPSTMCRPTRGSAA